MKTDSYRFAVYLSTPLELRIQRIKQRSYELHGKRVLDGGDMHEQELRFFDFVESRPSTKIDQWAQSLSCPIIHIDGTVDWKINAVNIAKQFLELKF